LIHRFTSLDILAHQIAQDILRDPNEYREMESALRPHLIEYLALLEMEDKEYELKSIESPSPSWPARCFVPVNGLSDAACCRRHSGGQGTWRALPIVIPPT